MIDILIWGLRVTLQWHSQKQPSLGKDIHFYMQHGLRAILNFVRPPWQRAEHQKQVCSNKKGSGENKNPWVALSIAVNSMPGKQTTGYTCGGLNR